MQTEKTGRRCGHGQGVGCAVALLLMVAAGDGYAADGGRWMTGPPAPTARTEVAAAAVDGVIYVIGGFEPRSPWTLWRASVSSRVEAYDPAAGRWSAKPDLPVGLHHAGAAVVDGMLYVVGGFTQSEDTIWQPSDRVFRFNAERGAWEERAPLPTARGGLGVATMRGHIVAVSGYDGQDNPAVVEVYDPDRDRWTAAASLPTPRDHLAVVVAGDTLYAIGGRVRLDYRDNLSTVDAYDAEQDRWAPAADLPMPRSGIAACVVDGWIYVFGGESGEGTFARNERYSPALHRWESMAPMPTARHGLGAVAVGGRVHVVSGGPSPGGSYSPLNEIFIPPARSSPTPMRSGGSGRTPAAHIGSVMTLLAVMDEADALPSESDAEADQLIHALIQYQSMLLNASDLDVRTVLSSALAEKFGPARADDLAEAFASTGWTSETLEALVDSTALQSAWEDPGWTDALGRHGVTMQDWALLERVFLRARERLLAQGKSVHTVYAARRAAMPGAQRAP